MLNYSQTTHEIPRFGYLGKIETEADAILIPNHENFPQQRAINLEVTYESKCLAVCEWLNWSD